MKNEINLMKTSISQCYVDSSHQISCKNFLYEKWNKFYENKYFAMLRWQCTSNILLRTSCMKNEINLMKTSISQCYVDSSHQISFRNFLYEKWNKFNENKVFCNVTLIVHIKYLVTNFLYEKWN